MEAVAVIILTFNAGSEFKDLLDAINQQNMTFAYRLVIDSGSTDRTVYEANSAGFEVVRVNNSDFDHGATRQLAVEICPKADFFVFLTQDAIPVNRRSISNLMKVFNEQSVGIAFGRQVPKRDASVLGAHARLYNYTTFSYVRSYSDRIKYGIKTVACSNSFAAYRKTALNDVQGFPKKVIFGEDVITAGRMLLKSWKIAYVAEAGVYHSHNYNPIQEFRRYFDIGAFHTANRWLLDHFGKPQNEGVKYLRSELLYVFQNNILLLPMCLLSLAAKWIGYNFGVKSKFFPLWINRMLSSQPKYWKEHRDKMTSNDAHNYK